MLNFQLGALQYEQFRSFGLPFCLVPCFPAYVSLCKSSSLISFSRFNISVSGVRVLFVLSDICIQLYLFE